MGIAISLRISVAIILMSCQSVLIWLVSDVLLRSFGNHSVVAEKIFKKTPDITVSTCSWYCYIFYWWMLAECGGQLSAEGFYVHEGGLYCTDDYQSLFGVRCSYCHQFVTGEVVTVLQHTYHDACFCCTVCRRVAGVHSPLRSAQSISKSINVFISKRQTETVATILCTVLGSEPEGRRISRTWPRPQTWVKRQ